MNCPIFVKKTVETIDFLSSTLVTYNEGVREVDLFDDLANSPENKGRVVHFEIRKPRFISQNPELMQKNTKRAAIQQKFCHFPKSRKHGHFLKFDSHKNYVLRIKHAKSLKTKNFSFKSVFETNTQQFLSLK